MILNVPTRTDFEKQAVAFLNIAWDAVFELLVNYSNIEEWFEEFEKIETDSDAYKDYWSAAEKPLSIAHALSQQGAELMLKAKITEVSPYFIISNSPREWPSKCNQEDVEFADFRTIDAQDLIKVHDTVCQNKLPEDFINTFTEFRKQRNAIFHTVDNRLKFSVEVIISYILDTAALCFPKEWPRLRNENLENQPTSQAVGNENVTNQLCREMNLMIGLLKPKQLSIYFDFNKKQRCYICPSCYCNMNRDYDDDYPMTAQLKPNKPSSTNLFCFVCGENTTVIREDCKEDVCKGNVIHAKDDKECLTCFGLQE